MSFTMILLLVYLIMGYRGVYRLSAKAQSIWYGAPACDGVGYFDFGVYVDPFTGVRTSC